MRRPKMRNENVQNAFGGWVFNLSLGFLTVNLWKKKKKVTTTFEVGSRIMFLFKNFLKHGW